MFLQVLELPVSVFIKIRLEIETSMDGCQPLQKEKILSALKVHGRNEGLTQKIHSIILESFC